MPSSLRSGWTNECQTQHNASKSWVGRPTARMGAAHTFIARTIDCSRVAVTNLMHRHRRTQSDNAPGGPVPAYVASVESLPDSDVFSDECLRSVVPNVRRTPQCDYWGQYDYWGRQFKLFCLFQFCIIYFLILFAYMSKDGGGGGETKFRRCLDRAWQFFFFLNK